jgi:hypothetical protein
MKFNVIDFFYTTDQMAPSKFSDYFQESAVWIFGNNPPIQGREAIKGTAEFFFTQLRSIKHELSSVITEGDKLFFEGYVSYDMKKFDHLITLPFACSIELKDNLILAYRTYVDTSPLKLNE